MRVRFALAALLAASSACSFIDDFDRFSIRDLDAGTRTDGGPGAGDAGGEPGTDASVDGGDTTSSCAGRDDGTPCGESMALVCIAGACRVSVCGDGFVNRALGEDCEDGNLTRRDGCEPDTCAYSCSENADCDNDFVCDGQERCVDHVCIEGSTTGAQGDACKRFDGVDGLCDQGYCVPPGCGDGNADPEEQCDGEVGCRPDCTMGCASDDECFDDDLCDAVMECDEPSGECLPGDAPTCNDGDACTKDGCEPAVGCVYTLIDADRDGVSPKTCAPASKYEGGDCDDGEASVRPGATEYCDGLDNDCDEKTDESAVKATCYPDRDGDGFPLEDGGTSACSCPDGTMPPRADGKWDCWDDPNDAGRDVYPGQTTSFAVGYDAHCASPSGPCEVVKRYDYDCDDQETPLYTDGGATTCGALGGALGCTPSGFMGEPPACGESAPYLTCTPNGGLLGGCTGNTAARTQPCR